MKYGQALLLSFFFASLHLRVKNAFDLSCFFLAFFASSRLVESLLTYFDAHREQAFGFGFDFFIAFAGKFFDAGTVQDSDPAVVVVNQATLLKRAGCFVRFFRLNAQHVSDQLVGHDDLTGRRAVKRHQDPATQLLLDRVVAVAGGSLDHLGDQCGNIHQKKATQGPMLSEFLPQNFALEPIGMAGVLYDGAAFGLMPAHE